MLYVTLFWKNLDSYAEKRYNTWKFKTRSIICDGAFYKKYLIAFQPLIISAKKLYHRMFFRVLDTHLSNNELTLNELTISYNKPLLFFINTSHDRVISLNQWRNHIYRIFSWFTNCLSLYKNGKLSLNVKIKFEIMTFHTLFTFGNKFAKKKSVMNQLYWNPLPKL